VGTGFGQCFLTKTLLFFSKNPNVGHHMTKSSKPNIKRAFVALAITAIALFFAVSLTNELEPSNIVENSVIASPSQNYTLFGFEKITQSNNQTKPITENSTSATNQTLESSLDSEKQPAQPQLNQPIFDVNVAYAYVGPAVTGEPFDFNGAPMQPITKFQSVIYFNFTRIFSSQAQAFDAILEVYLIELKTDTGYLEKYKYFVGTDCSKSFQSSDLNNITMKTYSLIDENSIDVERGIFRFDWNLNQSVIAMPIGTIGVYGSGSSQLGLWSKGEPQTITIKIYRMGWATAQCSKFSSIREQPPHPLLEVQLEKYGEGFLHNTVIPKSQLTKINLLSPDL
jgi:hypothetical protein